MEIGELAEQLRQHEHRSEWRYEELCKKLGEAEKETRMSEGINTDKVIVNAGGSGSDGGNMAAVIAALGNRNQGNDNAALIAALGNRNDDSNSWAPMLAAMNSGRRGYGDDGFGMGGMGGILGIAALGLIFGRGRGGLFGGDGDGAGGGETRLQSNADTLALLGAIGNTKDAVTGGFATTGLALSQGFAGVKDSVQASTFLLTNQINNTNQNVSEQACKTREVVQATSTAILQALAEAKLDNLKNELLELRGRSHARDTEISVNQTVNQAQAQQQQQQLVDGRFRRIEDLLSHVVQVAHATNSNVIAGNTGAVTTGAQTANPTNVNA